MSSIGGFFRGVWRGLDGLRRVLHLILLLLLFGFIIGALRSTVPSLPARAALLIQPHGQIVEQKSGDPIEIAFNEARGQAQSETLLWDLTESIRAAAHDGRVQAIEIYLDPVGEVLLEGYERYRMYYKGLLDKLAVDVHLFRVGEFKSAAEDMVRTGMSEQDRLESQVYLQSLWNSYKAAIA